MIDEPEICCFGGLMEVRWCSGVSLPILTDDGEKDVLIFVLFLGKMDKLILYRVMRD